MQEVGLCVMLTGNVLDILHFRLKHNIFLVMFCYIRIMRNARQAHALQVEFC